MTKMKTEFIEENLEVYSETQGVLPEKLEEFGDKYREQGYLTQEQLYEIAYESSTRSAYHVRKNTEERCREVTQNVLEVEGDFSKIALICSLKGFKAPTASCVLTALNPEKHAVVDTRVWASLERLDCFKERKESFTPDDYIEMIKPIREIAEETGYSTSEVGYALFAYDYIEREGTLH
jgi:thermostable 8-oxoguanine DNA glycosylase